MSEFHKFSSAVDKRFREMSKGELYTVEVLDLFETYLGAFPAGTNPLFRTRTEHDCSCCKNFIRNVGHLVAIVDGKVATVWDIDGLPHPYDVVAKVLGDLVRQAPIKSVFRTKERKYGAPYTIEVRDDGASTHRWSHFACEIAKTHVSTTPDKVRGEFDAAHQVLNRGLKELTTEALDTVIDLIESNSIYRGAEFKRPVAEFVRVKRAYDEADDPSLFVWQNIANPVAKFRNSAIGTLVEDLSNGVPLEKAVKVFESKVAPGNYKRSSALITPKMIEAAVAKLAELGLESAVQRRFAKISDVSVNNVLFVDNSVKGKMKDGLAGLLMESVKPATVDVKNAEAITMDEFLTRIVPQASSIDLLLKNKHLPNFVSVTAPEDPAAGRLFKWDNDFAWSYDGEVADSMREAVKARGGSVDGVLRFTHQWNDVGRNASLMDLHVFMPGHSFTKGEIEAGIVNDAYGSGRRVGWNSRSDHLSGGVQDVDYTSAAPSGYVPVENITFPDLRKMPEGDYVMKIHNWQLRSPTTTGFKAEIEFAGQVFKYEHLEPLANKEWITLAVVTLRAGQFSIRHIHPTTNASQKKWGVDTETLVPVDTLMLSPNFWDDQTIGNKHWFFILKGCANPSPARGIYNEFLKSELDPHRKVFEVLGAKTKCPVTDEQLSGVGFSSTRQDTATVIVKGSRINKAFQITF